MKNRHFVSPFRLRLLPRTLAFLAVIHGDRPDNARVVASFSSPVSLFATNAGARLSLPGQLATMTRLRASSPGNNDNENSNDDGDGDGEKKDEVDFEDAMDEWLTQKDAFLDRPFFDPARYDEDDESVPGRLARLVRADYPLAEAAFATVYFVALVVLAKELLRMQLYGAEYVPFQQGVAPGKLF